MKQVKKINKQSTKKQSGATMVEYGIMVALIAAIAIATIAILGTEVRDGFQAVVDAIQAAGS